MYILFIDVGRVVMISIRILREVSTMKTNSVSTTLLASVPPPFRARFHYAHAANIRSKLAANVYRMRIMKTRMERGKPGTDATTLPLLLSLSPSPSPSLTWCLQEEKLKSLENSLLTGTLAEMVHTVVYMYM